MNEETEVCKCDDIVAIQKECDKHKPKQWLMAMHFASLAAGIVLRSKGHNEQASIALIISFGAMYCYLRELGLYVKVVVTKFFTACVQMDIRTLDEFKKVIEETRADVARERSRQK